MRYRDECDALLCGMAECLNSDDPVGFRLLVLAYREAWDRLPWWYRVWLVIRHPDRRNIAKRALVEHGLRTQEVYE